MFLIQPIKLFKEQKKKKTYFRVLLFQMADTLTYKTLKTANQAREAVSAQTFDLSMLKADVYLLASKGRS